MKIPTPIILAGLILFFTTCTKDFDSDNKYSRPSWLAGKLYTQVKDQPDISTFARCLELSGYDTIIDKSGSYTVFAPNNEAFTMYLQENPEYGSVEDIPHSELVRIVKYHIVQNPWSTEQLRSLDIYGWIDSLDINNDEPRGYKRATLLRDKDRNYGIAQDEDDKLIIVDTLKSDWYRRQTTDSRKYAPIFYKEYFSIYELNPSDYDFYFGRPFEGQRNMYFAGAKILQADIFAENGFIHIIDRVVEPLENAFQILNSQSKGYSYTKFLDLVNSFPEFTYNEEKTNDQPGADLGYVVDSLFDITYPDLAFAITNELTRAPSGTLGLPENVTIRYHHGLIAPTNEAFDAFVNEYLVGPNTWEGLDNAPLHIKRMMANTHMSAVALYPTDFTNGFYNGESDLITLNQADVVQKQYGSNCTFVGVNKMLAPRAFTSVTGPVYLQRGYSRAMYAIEESGLLPALKRENENYLLFVESDANLRIDSSLVYYAASETFSVFLVTETGATEIRLTTKDLRNLILNHVGVGYPKGIARKEFIKNLAGNYLIVNNETGEVRGLAPTTIGYKGLVQTTVIPEQISTNADNGRTYDITNWFSFSAPTLYLKISGSYPTFHNLLKQAGLTRDKEYRYSFISENENYTVFVPSDAALAGYRYDTLTIDELKKFLMMHFIQGSMIFTDGNTESGYYETTRVDEKSTTYTTVYTKLHVYSGYDVITIPDKQGFNYLSIPESSKTNIVAARNMGEGTEAYPIILSNAVIHEIDRVLIFNEVDTQ